MAEACHWQGSQACGCLCCSRRIWPGQSRMPEAPRSQVGNNSHRSKWTPSPKKIKADAAQRLRETDSALHQFTAEHEVLI